MSSITDPLDATLKALLAEEESLTDAIKKAEVRLTRVRAARVALEALASDEPAEFEGKLADACREVLRRSMGKSLSPLEIRDQLKIIGFDTATLKHKNVMAAVHSVLKRMAGADKDVRSKEARDGSGTRYWWAGPILEFTTRSSRRTPDEIIAGLKVIDGPAMAEALKSLGALDLSDIGKGMEEALKVAKQFDLPTPKKGRP